MIENPIWKTSYRLVLDKKEKPYLQGWAIVENPTDEDWKDVRMALVSGRPISFQMDLYQPLYVPRPVVEPELFASLRPPTYSGALARQRLGSRRATGSRDAAISTGGRHGRAAARKDKLAREASARRTACRAATAGCRRNGRDVDEQHGPAARASAPPPRAAKLGDFFQYAIDKPGHPAPPEVGHAAHRRQGHRGHAGSASTTKRTQAKFPLLGLKLKNTSGLHLMQGPITVFEGSNYAGDARILDLQPNEERLISYAIDLGTEVNPVPSPDNGRITSVKAVKGIIYTTTKIRETKTYTIKNRNDVERIVLIEHPVRNDFKLIDTDKPVETASDFYRFQVKVARRQDRDADRHRGTHHRPDDRQSSNSDDDTIRFFISQHGRRARRSRTAWSKAMKLRWAHRPRRSGRSASCSGS